MTPRERTRDVGIFGRLLGFGEMAIVVPVEAPHLVRAVARAGARADAAVVDHLVDAFRRMHRGMNRAAHLARRLLAMHARHRLEDSCADFRHRRCSSGRRAATAFRGRARPGPCRPPARCSRHCRPKRRRCSRCRDRDRSPCPRHVRRRSVRLLLVPVRIEACALSFGGGVCGLFGGHLAHEIEAIHAVMRLRRGDRVLAAHARDRAARASQVVSSGRTEKAS